MRLQTGFLLLVLSASPPINLAQNQAPVVVRGMLQDAKGTFLPSATIAISGAASSVTTGTGAFKFQLPRDMQKGSPILFVVPRWIIISPSEGRTGQKFIDKDVMDVVVVVARKGDPELLSAEQLKRMVVDAIASAKESQKPSDNDAFIVAKAAELGFTPEQLRAAIDEWVSSVRQPFEQGVAATYKGQFEEARSLISKSIASSEFDLMNKYITLANADHLSEHFQDAIDVLNKALAVQPDNPAALRLLGHNYYHLDRPDLARPLLEKALDVWQVQEGDSGEDLPGVLDELGEAYTALSEMSLAEKSLRRSLLIRQQHGKDSFEIGYSSALLASILGKEGNAKESRSLFAQAIPLLKAAGASREEYLSKALLEQGAFLISIGDFHGAEASINEGIDSAKRSQGPEGFNVAAGLKALADISYHMNNFSQSEQLHAQAIAIDLKYFSDDSLNYSDDLWEIGWDYFQEGKYSDAEKARRGIVSIRTAKAGNDYRRYPFDLLDWADALDKCGRTSEALAIYVKAQDIARAANNRDQVLNEAYSHLASHYAAVGDFDNAEIALQKEASELPPKNRQARDLIATQYKTIGIVASKKPDYKQTLRFFMDGINLYADSDQSGLELPVTLTCFAADTEVALLDAGRAEALFLQGTKLGVSLPRDSQAIDFCWNGLGNLYYDEKQYENAANAYSALKRKKESESTVDQADVARLLSNICKAQYRYGKLDVAEDNCRRAVTTAEQTPSVRPAEVGWYQGNLALVLAATGRLADAEELYRKALSAYTTIADNDRDKATLKEGLDRVIAQEKSSSSIKR